MSTLNKMPMAHWLDTDLFVNGGIEAKEINIAVEEIRLQLSNHIAANIDKGDVFILDIRLHANKTCSLLFHLTADLAVIPSDKMKGALIPDPGHSRVSAGVPKTGPTPPGPPIIDSRVFIPVDNDYILSSEVRSIGARFA